MEVIMSDNPYQSPQTLAGTAESVLSSGAITETMVYYLKGAAPWLRFLGIIGFIGCGILVVSGLVMLIAMPSFIQDIAVLGSLAGASVGGLYIVLGVVGFFPTRFIYCFGARIRNFLRNNSEQELEQAFKYNKSFWKFSGIVTIIYLAIIPIAIVIGIIAVIGSSAF
jgi:hypothetical protein